MVLLSNFKPHPKLVTKSTLVDRPRFPVVDAHNHLGDDFGGGWDKKPVNELLDVLDSASVSRLVDLDGGWGEALLQTHLEHFKAAAPDRFRIFGGVDWRQWSALGDRFGEWAGQRLRMQAGWGAEGLKIWKGLGLSVRDQHGELVRIDDQRLDPIWHTAAELKLPVMIHIADPVAFFDPLDEHNERWEELQANPDWQFPSPPFPPFDALMQALFNLVQTHHHTQFIGAHVGCYAENLDWVGRMLDACPNTSIDFSARIAELGRQPYSARRFFMKYADRILFGMDQTPRLAFYQLYYRFLESEDEYFSYGLGEIPTQGRWQIYGLNLPDEVLEKVYSGNFERLFGKLDY